MLEMLAYYKQLAIEAISVGALLIPIIFLVSKLVKMTPIQARFRPGVTIFLAGAFFHLFAEFSGINKWYLENSAAKMLASGRAK